MKFYLYAWKRSFDFTGTAGRNEFWWFFLIHFMVSITCIAVDIALGDLLPFSWIDAFYSVVSLPALLAAITRRLRDIGKSGVWGWVFLIPVIGPFWLTYMLVQPTSKREGWI
ncbi:DUF805 domain-containing protein [Vibrio sonorensis]|uniref:DUF805 domain-containing protein n=1 Tax=Vibrio sonorensis TaxID=1004316 RepID=UPI0008D90795|nr:DUF805 domain-containing protein [Vibrio sonorensis]